MTELRYDLSSADYEAFNLYFMETSDFGRRQRRQYRLLLGLVTPFAVYAIIAFGFNDHRAGLIFGSLTGLLLSFLAPRLWRREVVRNLKRLTRDPGIGATGAHHLLYDANGVRESVNGQQTAVGWDSVDRVVETEEYVYLFFGPLQAFIVPKRVDPAAVTALVDFANSQTRQPGASV